MEDNVGDGRVSGEYDNWPCRAEYNLDEESDDEGVGEVGNGTRCWTTKHKVAVSLTV